MYNLTRKEMIDYPVSLSVIWDNDDEQWLECSEDLIIEGLDDTHEGMGEDDGYNRRIKVTGCSIISFLVKLYIFALLFFR